MVGNQDKQSNLLLVFQNQCVISMYNTTNLAMTIIVSSGGTAVEEHKVMKERSI